MKDRTHRKSLCKAGIGSSSLPTGESCCWHKGSNSSPDTCSPWAQLLLTLSSCCSAHKSSLQWQSQGQSSPHPAPAEHVSPPTPQAAELGPCVAPTAGSAGRPRSDVTTDKNNFFIEGTIKKGNRRDKVFIKGGESTRAADESHQVSQHLPSSSVTSINVTDLGFTSHFQPARFRGPMDNPLLPRPGEQWHAGSNTTPLPRCWQSHTGVAPTCFTCGTLLCF